MSNQNTMEKTQFYQHLSDEVNDTKTISKTEAENIFNFFKSCSLFRWHDANNDCEDRANAVCLLLDSWFVPNSKGWVFSGYYLKNEYGNLINQWNFHVAAALPVLEDNSVVHYVIDPATQSSLVSVKEWAAAVTDIAYSYHFIKSSNYYIFPVGIMEKDNWHKRDRRNYRWTMQGLSGINGVSIKGKAQLAFRRQKVKSVEAAFNKLRRKRASMSGELL